MESSLIKNKKGNMFVSIFIFLIVSFSIILIFGVFLYMINEVIDELHSKLDTMGDVGDAVNYTDEINNNMGVVQSSYTIFYWASIFLMIGMVTAIFIGAYAVTVRPAFFPLYIIFYIIAIVLSVGVSNGYGLIQDDTTIGSTFSGFLGANFIILKLPIWIAVIGGVGGIIMFIKFKQAEGVASF